MQSKQDFLLGVEQSHISANGKKQAQRQHLSVSLSFAQHDPQHSSDIHEGHMFIPCDLKHCLIRRTMMTRARYDPTTIITIAAVDKVWSLVSLGSGVGRVVGTMMDLFCAIVFTVKIQLIRRANQKPNLIIFSS